VTEGALVTAQQATALTTVSTLDPIYVDVDQSSTELVALKRAVEAGTVHSDGPLIAEVTLKLDDGSSYPTKGKLQFTDVTVDPATGAITTLAGTGTCCTSGEGGKATLARVDPRGLAADGNGG